MNDVKFTPEKDGDEATGKGELSPKIARPKPVITFNTTNISGPDKITATLNAPFEISAMQEPIEISSKTRQVITFNKTSIQGPGELTTPLHTPFEVNTMQGPLELPPTPQDYLNYVQSLGPKLEEIQEAVKETEKLVDLSEEANIYDHTKVNKATQCIRFPKKIERGEYLYNLYFTFLYFLHFYTFIFLHYILHV